MNQNKYILMMAEGCIPASQANGQTIYLSKSGRRLIVYTPSTTPKRLAERGTGRGVPYRAEGSAGPVYGWLPPDYPLRPIGPKTAEFDASEEGAEVEELEEVAG